ncbi:MAG: FKBP-type peptidyl-prolyl cis-trans isomerase [Acidobacteriota bacterium]
MGTAEKAGRDRMRSGVKAKDIVIGTGEEAVHGKTVAANVRLFLNHGTELTGTLTGDPRMVVDLKRRDCIAGLRYGIEGMRVGGIRELKISPHLAYGASGIPGYVPPNAVIHAVVELLDVRESGVRKPEDYPPGKHLFVFHPGIAARNQPRWQFGLEEDGRSGVSLTHSIPGMPWRHASHSHLDANVDAETARSLLVDAAALPKRYPTDCFRHEELWADMAESGNAITRDRATNSLCLTIGVMERGQWVVYYSLAETSQALKESPLLKWIGELLEHEAASKRREPPNKIEDHYRSTGADAR